MTRPGVMTELILNSPMLDRPSMTYRVDDKSSVTENRPHRFSSNGGLLGREWSSAWCGLLRRTLNRSGHCDNNELLQRLGDCSSAMRRLVSNFDFRITTGSEPPSRLGLEASW